MLLPLLLLLAILGVTSIVVISSFRATLLTTKAVPFPYDDNIKPVSIQNVNAIKLETVEEDYEIALSPVFSTESPEFIIDS